MSFDWKKTLATIAPKLATALGGPLAGVAVNMATKALGIEANEDALESIITSGDPEVLLKLKQVEKDFTVEMRRLDIKETELSNEDRQGARQLFKVNKWPQIILSTIFIVGYFIILGLLLSGNLSIPQGLGEVVMLLLGLLTREVPTIMQFWFGSSSGSKDKDKV